MSDQENIQRKFADLEKRIALIESVTQPIFKSSLVKGAVNCLFWSELMGCYVSPAEIQCLQHFTEVLGGTCDEKGKEAVRLFQLDARGMVSVPAVSSKDANLIAQAQLPRNRTPHPKFLDPLMSRNMHVAIKGDILQQLCNNYVSIMDAGNTAAHEMTPLQLRTFIQYLKDGSDDKQFYAALFAFVFQFPYTDTEEQPDDVKFQILTNCSGNTLFSLDSDTIDINEHETKTQ